MASTTRFDLDERTGRGMARVGCWLIPVLVAITSAIPFIPALAAGFVRWDDDVNFLTNSEFGDLTGDHVRWAWTTCLLGVYQPLSWMLLELEHTAWGLDPRGFHALSLALHAINSVVLYRLTVAILGRCGLANRASLWIGSALAALLFAIHPLRVEVVAWVSCQPYLPAILLAMLAVMGYLQAHPEEGTDRAGWLALSWLLLVAALLFKAVVVGLPLVLLVLDAYPLRRLRPMGRSGLGVWVEKLVFLAPAVGMMAFALHAKSYSPAAIDVSTLDLSGRFAQACYGVWFYLLRTAWPVRLSAFYPVPARLDLLTWPFSLAALAAVGTSGVLFRFRSRYPGLLAAWVTYVLILIPNLGLIRSGPQLVADRYAYLASIPLVILTGAALVPIVERSARHPLLTMASGLTALGLLGLLGTISWTQCRVWQTSTRLWSHASALTGGSCLDIEGSLAASLIDEGQVERGVTILRQILQRDPNRPMVHYNLGVYLVLEGRPEEAKEHFEAAVRGLTEESPFLADAHYYRGVILEQSGRLADALAAYSRAAELNPRDAATQNNLGSVLLQLGDYDGAETRFAQALRLRPDHPLALRGLQTARRLQAQQRRFPIPLGF